MAIIVNAEGRGNGDDGSSKTICKHLQCTPTASRLNHRNNLRVIANLRVRSRPACLFLTRVFCVFRNGFQNSYIIYLCCYSL